MTKKKVITGYQVRRKDNNGIRYTTIYLEEAKKACQYGCVVCSTYAKAYGIKLRLFWMAPYRKIGYDKYSNVFNIFHIHIGWELMKRDEPLKIVFEPEDQPIRGEI